MKIDIYGETLHLFTGHTQATYVGNEVRIVKLKKKYSMIIIFLKIEKKHCDKTPTILRIVDIYRKMSS